MLKELSIKNFAIIDDVKVDFTKGLNLLTGETGSGKSIIIEALEIVLGGRSSKDLIRSGEDKAIIEALFFIDEDIIEIIRENGFDSEENVLILTKEIFKNYPSISRINGRPITINLLRNITSKLIDIFGQHEHQSLLNISNHQLLIDSFGDTEFNELLGKIQQNYELYSIEKKKLNELNISSHEREREIDLLKFQIDEIEEANLTTEDDEKIEVEFNRVSNIVNIITGLNQIIGLISGTNYDNNSILDLIDRTISILNNVCKYDKGLESYLNRLQDIRYEMQDLSRGFDTYAEGLEVDEEKLLFLNARLDIVNKLKKKYGLTVNKILEYKNNINEQYEKLINYENEIEKIKKNISKYEVILAKDSELLSNKRKIIAEKFESLISKELEELNMNNVIFKVNFDKKPKFSATGLDSIEFLISTNPGETLKPISKIVSGGEMSRIMLGFKSIIADNDRIPTLIFDEIDTGISGRTAQVVGEKIKRISHNHQVISISHLPQIAALADSHYVIDKNIINGKAQTNIKKLSDNERVKEMARLLGGVNVTETTLNHAKEMLEMSKKI
ncbi:DNA repair protein RecN [Tissierella sp. Yu-01]|uniref:DNA repair protein RecN n=1 Tax=Tissierella sp. Yu-01 TaxID=3035694 RepID=UPI00240E01CD|nr:DNA repair protein RecN [Tissierella sp. Yu-01]WFA09701.1 DNA repair protein RecN [Tissierella sp. Yu-01]